MALRNYRGVSPVLGERVFIDECALVIGRVTMGDDSSLWPFAVARGDVNRIEIGARTNIQDGSVLHVVHDGPSLPSWMLVRAPTSRTAACCTWCTTARRCRAACRWSSVTT
jgi:carbonic anhydrase/acetyltransferase-like protein (isoleucine patch superfamily)